MKFGLVLEESHSDDEEEEENRDDPRVRFGFIFFYLLLDFLFFFQFLLLLNSFFFFFYFQFLLSFLPLLILYLLFPFFLLLLFLLYLLQLLFLLVGQICQFIPPLNGFVFWEIVGVCEIKVECGLFLAINFFSISFLLFIVLLEGLHPKRGFLLLFELLVVLILFLRLLGGHGCEYKWD